MRNLRIVKKVTLPKHLPVDKTLFCTGDNGSLLMVRNDIFTLTRISPEHHMLEELCQSDLLEGVEQAQFVLSTGYLFLSTSTAFLQFDLSSGEGQQLFQSEEGITTFAVSPDSRVVAIVTKRNNLLLLRLPDLEVIAQVDSTAEILKGDNEKRISISWRHDSAYFAINYFCKETDARRLCIFNESGTVVSKTEDINPLVDNVIAWQPSGGLLATVGQSVASKANVVVSLFELNGLKRADFSPTSGLPEKSSGEVRDLLWSSSSDILAIRTKSHVELWTRNNYVWMRKTIIRGDKEKSNVHFAGWDADIPLRLHVVFENGQLSMYDLTFDYSFGFSTGSALVSSVNGSTIYCTPFRDNCAPPPYGFLQQTFENQIKQVIIPSFRDGVACILDNGQMKFYPNNKNTLDVINLKDLPHWDQYSGGYNFCWPNEKTVCCIWDGQLVVVTLTPEQSKFESYDIGELTSIHPIHFETNESTILLYQTTSGNIGFFDLVSRQATFMVKFPQYFSHLTYITDKLGSEDVERALTSVTVIGFDFQTRKLYAARSDNSSLLSADATSVGTFQDHILYTTVQGSLSILNSDQITDALEHKPSDHYSRKVEKGSVIVTCCVNQMLEPSLVLQIIPRGNLEVIFPRPLVVSEIKRLLRCQEYTKIMAAMRRHRIDYNVLIYEMKTYVNNDPELLRQNLNDMITQVGNSHSLVLLVTDMNDSNMDCVREIKSICEEVTRSNAGVVGEEAYLAAMAKLNLYAEVVSSHLITGDESVRETVKGRIKFLSFYCDNPEILYEAALGTYDLNLTAVIADCLGKDPKEYLPILNDFRSQTELKMRYNIDHSLRRYSKALESLLMDTTVDDDEILKYMQKYCLYNDALKYLSIWTNTLPPDCSRNMPNMQMLLTSVQNAYGAYLQDHGKLKEASVFFERGGNNANAIDACLKSGCWESAVAIGIKNLPEQELQGFFKKVVDSLENNEDFESAAHVSELYLKDLNSALNCLIKGRKWLTARRLCLQHFETETVVARITPKLVENVSTLEQTLDKMFIDIKHYVQRLKWLKENIVARPDIDESGDHFSDTASMSTGSFRTGSLSSSNLTGKTSRSGKNKRKLERKVYSLKEGSPYESIGITMHLWEMFNRLHLEVKKEVSITVEACWRFDVDDRAIGLTETFDRLLVEVEQGMKFVWETILPEHPGLDSKFRLPPVCTTTWDKLMLRTSSTKTKVQ